MNINFYLGRTRSGTPMHFTSMDNPHICLTGRSGCGKSYFLRQLLLQAVEQGALGLVFDYSGDFRRFVPSPGLPFRRVDITSPEFTINPFLSGDGLDVELGVQQLLHQLHGVFRMGSRATLALRQAAQQYLASNPNPPTLEGLCDLLRHTRAPSQGLLSAREPLELLASLLHCGNQPIGLELNHPGLVVLDFARVVDGSMRTFLVELTLRAVWTQRTTARESAACPVVVALDECQNISWSEQSMAIRILREGRKFDLAGWFSTQWIDKKAEHALGQAALQAHFRPEDRDISRLARSIGRDGPEEATLYRQLLHGLNVGQFLWPRPNGQAVVVNVDP